MMQLYCCVPACCVDLLRNGRLLGHRSVLREARAAVSGPGRGQDLVVAAGAARWVHRRRVAARLRLPGAVWERRAASNGALAVEALEAVDCAGVEVCVGDELGCD